LEEAGFPGSWSYLSKKIVLRVPWGVKSVLFTKACRDGPHSSYGSATLGNEAGRSEPERETAAGDSHLLRSREGA
jgi:hypothetical protein